MPRNPWDHAITIIEDFVKSGDTEAALEAAEDYLEKIDIHSFSKIYGKTEVTYLTPLLPLLAQRVPMRAIELIPRIIQGCAGIQKERKYAAIDYCIATIGPATAALKESGGSPLALTTGIMLLLEHSNIPTKKRVIEEALPAIPVIAECEGPYPHAQRLSMKMIYIMQDEKPSSKNLGLTATIFATTLPVLAKRILEDKYPQNIVAAVIRAAHNSETLKREIAETFIPIAPKLGEIDGRKLSYFLEKLYKAVYGQTDLHRQLNEAIAPLVPAITREDPKTGAYILRLMAGDEHEYSTENLFSTFFARVGGYSGRRTWFVPDGRDTMMITDGYIGPVSQFKPDTREMLPYLKSHFEEAAASGTLVAEMYRGKKSTLETSRQVKALLGGESLILAY